MKFLIYFVKRRNSLNSRSHRSTMLDTNYFYRIYLVGCISSLLIIPCSSNLTRSNEFHHLDRSFFTKVKPQETIDDVSYDFDTSQEDPDPLKLGGISISEEAKKLSLKLRQISNDEIGVTTIQGFLDSQAYTDVTPDYEGTLGEMSGLMKTKLEKYLKLLYTSKITVEDLYESQPVDHRLDCCNIPNSDLKWDDVYQTSVNREFSCDLLPLSAVNGDYTFNPGRNLTEVFQHSVQYMPRIKWQYFISTNGIHNEYPTHNYPTLLYSDCKNVQDYRHRGLILSTLYKHPKNVVIIIDQGNSLSTLQLKISKAIAKHIIFSLDQNDKVGVVSVSSVARYPQDNGCASEHLLALSYETKLYFSNFIDYMEKESAPVNHSLAFSSAFDVIRNSFPEDSREDVVIAYISRGLLSSLTEAKDVLSEINFEMSSIQHNVIINTYPVIDETKPVMYEKTFLQDVAEQNFSKYLIENPAKSRKGKMAAVNSVKNLNVLVGDIFEPFNWTVENKPSISLPVKDEIGKGAVFSLTWPCLHRGRVFGIIGLDVPAEDLLESSTYYTLPNSYAFVTDKRGYVIAHPSLERPVLMNIPPMYTEMAHYEMTPGFDSVQQRIISESSGRVTLENKKSDDSNSPHTSTSTTRNNNNNNMEDSLNITYLWQHIVTDHTGDVSFILVIKVSTDSSSQRELANNPVLGGQSTLVYQRLDLLPTNNTCIHLKQIATFDTNALFLAANAFVNPFDHLVQEETKRMVQGYLAYLTDNTNLISNPGLQENVRKDVIAFSQINSEWTRQSSLSDYIVRRYVATPSGVFRMYPGTLLNKNYDPSKQHWYMRALEYPGKVTLTAPYLDVGGAGYIVTISHTIYEGKSAALHGPSDQIAAVVGMDVTFKYFYKMLIDNMPICKSANIRCFIMDNRGYLIAHRGLIEANEKGPLEERHITHKEPLVTNDILNHKGFVTKKACRSFMDRTTQRYYQFNTSFDGIITNLVHGEHCARYQVTPIVGTNAFLGIVNQTCSMIRAFCPCSMVDRLCLNCHRMEQIECECPCECPLHMNFCSGKLLDTDLSMPSCPSFPEEMDVARASNEITKSFPQCSQPVCSQKLTMSDCLGILDCEWCELENDGVTGIRQPFCSTQRVCFGGVLGAQSPYNDHVAYRAALPDDATAFKSMPVGPVAGGIMGVFLLLALGVYCYRHRLHHHSRHYSSSNHEGRLRDSNNENDFEDLDDENKGHTNIILSTFETTANVNPYYVNTSYRRPTNMESDHGYSTMTPQEDSEQASTSCVESFVMSRDRYRPSPASRVSKSSSILPPPFSGSHRTRADAIDWPLLEDNSIGLTSIDLPPPVDQTYLPEQTMLLPHQIVANVQVHTIDAH